MVILGLSAYYHDSAACIIEDGKVLVAVEEERFTRIKHDNSFPRNAIKYCLEALNITIAQVDAVAYYEKPLLKFERILETFIQTYPFSLRPFLKGIPEWLDYKIKIESTIKKTGYKRKIFYIPHHYSHAASAFYPSPFKKSAILTIDGVGEYQATGLWMGKNSQITPIKSINFPHSLGLLYSTFTSYLGFKINEDEYKMMGLAAYGKPRYADKIRQLINVKDDGSFKLNMDYFGFRESFRMYNSRFENLLGPSRGSKEKITARHADIASSIQTVTEEIYFKILNFLNDETGCDNLCISGGVALNALANGKIYKKTRFKKIYALGASGDSGAAVGAALFVFHSLLKKSAGRKVIKDLYLGSEFNNKEIEQVLLRHDLKYKHYDTPELIDKTATLLARGNVVGWFQGKMEFGPRALGSRSILARPYPRSMKSRINLIKIREQFRPFAGSIIQSETHKYFDMPYKNLWSPFMNFCFKVKPERVKDLAAIVHPDGTCRIQTVNENNGRYFALLSKFYKKTGIPCVLNTSFNLKGEPIMESPEQAVNDFLKTKIDYLVIGDFLVKKITRSR